MTTRRLLFEVPLDPFPCARCASRIIPRIRFRVTRPSGNIDVCVACLGDAIQEATGWKVGSMFQQFLTVSPIVWPTEAVKARLAQEGPPE